jgi:hypothetical protein
VTCWGLPQNDGHLTYPREPFPLDFILNFGCYGGKANANSSGTLAAAKVLMAVYPPRIFAHLLRVSSLELKAETLHND